MLLQSVKISGFRSVPRSVELFVRDHLTCLIGANEHGKTNILDAVNCLTTEEFVDHDRNSSSTDESHPTIKYTFTISDKERTSLLLKLKERLRVAQERVREVAGASPPDPILIANARKQHGWYEASVKYYSTKKEASFALVLKADDTLSLWLNGVVLNAKSVDDAQAITGLAIPRARIFSPSAELADTITLEELNVRKNPPFEGLLKLAGVWEEKEALFEDDLEAHRLHVKAGKNLTRKLKRMWTQGEAHTIRLSPSGKGIRVSIEDPNTLDAPSRRSLGFRSFLSFALTLYSETDSFTPNGYILLFDEPGLHLHPQGQKDLLKELRRLSQSNQVIYTTHSPFLIDRNAPTSVLLVRKEVRGGERGTGIVQKPYGNNWVSVSNALGITPSDAFFPPDKVLLVEGTSDRLYVSRYMTLCAKQAQADLNYLHIADADRRDELPAMARMYFGAGSSIVVLVDADKGGDDFTKALKGTVGKKGQLQVVNLREFSDVPPPFSIEDLLPFDNWFDALCRYSKEILRCPRELAKDELRRHKRNATMGSAAAAYLVELGAIRDPKKFSKTTAADFFCQQSLPIPAVDDPIARLCKALARLLCPN